MKSVRLDKNTLLTTLRQNREKHAKDVAEAREGWKKEVMGDLEKAIEDIRSKGTTEFRYLESEPDDHTEDYDQAIRMLELSIDDVITLERDCFQNLVLDDWPWKKDFFASNAKYFRRR